jgi:hypothetical protein
MFDRDDILERVWDEADVLLPQLAKARYDWIVAPSFSCWWPRSRIEQMYNLKRSLRIFEALQYLGASTIPRIGWAIEADVERAAEWVTANTCIERVGLDFSTFRTPQDWQTQIDGLALLDRLTKHHLRYLVNGPASLERFFELLRIVPQRRISLTNATFPPPPVTEEPAQLQLAISTPSTRRSRAFVERCENNRAMLRVAGRLNRNGSMRSQRRARPRRREITLPRNAAK